MNTAEKRFIEADRRAVGVALAVIVFYLVSLLIFSSWRGDFAGLRNSALHYAAFWTQCVSMWVAAAYMVRLVIQSAGSGSFPHPSAKVTVRQRLWRGAGAHVARAVTILGAVSLVGLTAIFIYAVQRF